MWSALTFAINLLQVNVMFVLCSAQVKEKATTVRLKKINETTKNV